MEVEAAFDGYREQIHKKAAEVREGLAGGSSSVLRVDERDLLRRQTEVQEKMEKVLQVGLEDKADRLNESSRMSEERKSAAIAKAKVKYDMIVADSGELASKVGKVANWKEQSDLEVERAMRNVKNWREDLEKIVTLNRDLKELVISENIPEGVVSGDAADVLVGSAADELKEVTEAIEFEDDERALFTLDTVKPDHKASYDEKRRQRFFGVQRKSGKGFCSK